MEALVVQALSKRYPTRTGSLLALDSVDLTLPTGTLFAFLGRNGAGKTTLIKIAATLLTPTSGSVHLFGHDVVAEPRLVRPLIALVPQDGKPFFHLTPREHIREYLIVRGSSRAEARDRAQEMLGAMGLEGYADEPAYRLSGGLQQRTLVAMILATEAPFLFLDEPTLGMDPFARRQVWAVIRRAQQHGSTVLLTTHYLDEAEHLSKELAVIDGGRVLYRGSAERLKTTMRHEVRLQFTGGFTREELAVYGKVVGDKGRLTLLTTRAQVPEITQRALERSSEFSVGPVSLEEAFLELVGHAIEEEE